MTRICPNPMPWNEAYKRLTHFAETHDCIPQLPPKPLILAGWAYSNDIEKRSRWEETVVWADHNGYRELVSSIPDNEFYFVEEPTTYTVGPLGGPIFQPWDFESKDRPSAEVLEKTMEHLKAQWTEIAGKDISTITRPIAFTGNKARRLLVSAEVSSNPPWGGWTHLSSVEPERRTFTQFRASVNKAISPHEVDHIDFVTDENADQEIRERRSQTHAP
jgi:hypothetical protein